MVMTIVQACIMALVQTQPVPFKVTIVHTEVTFQSWLDVNQEQPIAGKQVVGHVMRHSLNNVRQPLVPTLEVCHVEVTTDKQ